MAKQVEYNKPIEPASIELESWSEGFMGGALIMMIMITLSNMRRTSLLHKLIFIELLIAVPDSFPMFFNTPVFGWYLSSTSMLMILSWNLHNVIAWMKNKPFLGSKSSAFYIGTVGLAQPYWILEIIANYLYFNHGKELFVRTRPFEALCRDPWWIFTTLNLFWNIKHRYGFGFVELIRVSPRFGIMLTAMSISMVFIILDLLSVTSVFDLGGLNPFWKLAFVFKCFTDTIVLDDFKTALDKLSIYKQNQIRLQQTCGGVVDSGEQRSRSRYASTILVPEKAGFGSIHVEKKTVLKTRYIPSATVSSEPNAGNAHIPRREVWEV